MELKNKKKVERGQWHFHVYVSKDSPQNTYRGFWGENKQDGEYFRGYSAPGAYTEKEAAIKALRYYESGYVYKVRHCRQQTKEWRETVYVCELNYKSDDYRYCTYAPSGKKEI
ncbi:hypothetical protein [Parabacteroides sp. PF5-9]|uniref:hypothetical protein n=1 Tax=Parabacteroides sp. PF5-9 TaxID=1742404 RepID=UPI002473AEA6|nr:hypothetical protein [Parabacteroides sp. PF5-9]MDH6358961.1 hypothetical protein [Parabacteroides sp. PF5-9]